MNRKEYLMPDGKRAVFEYDHDGVGKVTLEAMDVLMGMITDRPSGEWLWQLADNGWADHICSVCGYTKNTDIHVSLNWSYCPHCGSKMRGEHDD